MPTLVAQGLSVAFDDTVNEVSGTWVLERPPSSEPGLMIYVMVADAAAATDAVIASGGAIVQPVDPAGKERFATFRDPAGNVLGIYQQPGLAETEAAGREDRDTEDQQDAADHGDDQHHEGDLEIKVDQGHPPELVQVEPVVPRVEADRVQPGGEDHRQPPSG